jgi:hypothetical protein
LWPLLAALILLEQLFVRRVPIALTGALPDDTDSVRALVGHGDKLRRTSGEAEAEPHDTGADFRGSLRADLRPPTELLSSGTGKLVAFLIRNRGRIDNQVVRARWDQLDRVSLPLAIHLRQIEAESAWDVLEREIAMAPPVMLCVKGKPGSLRHFRILALLPDWVQRGDELLARWEPNIDAAAEPAVSPEPEPGNRSPLL